MAYKIYTVVNLADTSRDKDDFVYSTVGYRETLKETLKLINRKCKIEKQNLK